MSTLHYRTRNHSRHASARTIRRRCCPRSWRGRARCSIRRSSAERPRQSFVKLNPVTLVKNPVMFVVEVGAALTTVFLIRDICSRRAAASASPFQISLWLWFTVLFANFAEAMAEARGKAQADSSAQDQDRCRWQSG